MQNVKTDVFPFKLTTPRKQQSRLRKAHEIHIGNYFYITKCQAYNFPENSREKIGLRRAHVSRRIHFARCKKGMIPLSAQYNKDSIYLGLASR
jgi:hypothetical protein